MRLIRAVGAGLALLALLIGPPWALLRFIGNPWPAGGITWSAPLTDDAIIGLLATVVWVLWLQVAICILSETLAALTHDHIQIPAPFTLDVQRHLARRLVTALLVATVATPLIGPVAAATPPAEPANTTAAMHFVTGHAETGHPEGGPFGAADMTSDDVAFATPRGPGDNASVAPTSSSSALSASTGHHPNGQHPPTANAATTDQPPDPRHRHALRIASDVTGPRSTVTVMRLDSLWSIAERALGDGDRWPEIAALNEGRLMNDGTRFVAADTIRPGWEVYLPTSTAAATTPQGRATNDTRERQRILVEPGDTLSQIALDELGDAAAYPQLYEASRTITQPDGRHLTDPDLILPGWTIAIPPQPTTTHASTLDGPTDRTAHEPDRPPHGPASDGTAGTADDRRTPSHADTPGGLSRGDDQTHLTSADDRRAAVSPLHKDRGATPNGDTSEHEPSDMRGDESTEPAAFGDFSALRAMLATAVCLSGGAAALLLANRRRQFRTRRPGRMIAHTPTDLVPLERVLFETGREALNDVEFIDRALRHLARTCRESRASLPDVLAVVLDRDSLTLLTPTHPPADTPTPAGWTISTSSDPSTQLDLSTQPGSCAWVLPRTATLMDDLDTQPAPYPALVTIGLDENDRAWLLDLEAHGVVRLIGSQESVSLVARFLVAELAVNAWSEGTQVLLADDYSETIPLNPARLRTVDTTSALARASALLDDADILYDTLDVSLLERRRDDHLLDTTDPVVVMAATSADAASRRIAERIDGRIASHLRSRVVLMQVEAECAGSEPLTTPEMGTANQSARSMATSHQAGVEHLEGDTGLVLELSADGNIQLPHCDVRVRAFTLPRDDAEAMGHLLAGTRQFDDEPMPAGTHGETPTLSGWVNADGSMAEQHIEPRQSDGANETSILPAPDETYLATTATTSADLAALAPNIPSRVGEQIQALDPTLDGDVAAWCDSSSPRPKVHLLGPVSVTASTGDRTTLSNVAGTLEFIIYLACQERGVTRDRAADALCWSGATVQNRARDARRLLGTRPDGSEWLPDAGKSESARTRGIATYALDREVLVDADLFVRLRARANARGQDGLADLVCALSLVTGEPFDQLRRGGYGWLVEGHRHDHAMVAAITDVAHLVATRAIPDGDTELARRACHIAMKANPHSDVAPLDLAAAAEIEIGITDHPTSNGSTAVGQSPESPDSIICRDVTGRCDEDLPERTEDVIVRHNWLAS